jgi:TOBE domain
MSDRGEANLFPIRGDGRVAELGVVVGGEEGELAVIRPEALQVGPPTANGLSATVRDVSYQGIRYRVALQLDGESGATLVASLPDSVPSIQQPGRSEIGIGT